MCGFCRMHREVGSCSCSCFYHQPLSEVCSTLSTSSPQSTACCPVSIASSHMPRPYFIKHVYGCYRLDCLKSDKSSPETLRSVPFCAPTCDAQLIRSQSGPAAMPSRHCSIRFLIGVDCFRGSRLNARNSLYVVATMFLSKKADLAPIRNPRRGNISIQAGTPSAWNLLAPNSEFMHLGAQRKRALKTYF